MLVVDLLHEFELGVWKSIFTHLIRLLFAAGKGSDSLVVELDARYAFIFLIMLLFTYFTLQISPNFNIWLWHHSEVFSKFFRNEKTSCSGF